MSKKTDTDISCSVCGSTQFVLGRSYNACGNTAYVLRCAHCANSKGEPTFIKNVNDLVYNALLNAGRIIVKPTGAIPPASLPVAEPQGTVAQPQFYRRKASPSAESYARAVAGMGIENNAPQTSAIPPKFNYPTSSYSQDDIPAPPLFGSVDNSAESDMPFDTSSDATGANNDYDIAPTVSRPAERSVTRPDNCPVCRLGRAVRVPSSNYSCYISSGYITYYTDGTGAILFSHKIDFCPFCGNNLSSL